MRRGDRQARDGNQTKLITNAQKERSENSQGKLRLNQQLAREQQQQRIAEARARCAPDIQRVMLSPECSVPNGKLIVQLINVALPFGHAQPINLTLTGPMRMAILGANGSGKSTLLQVIAGQLPARAGGGGAQLSCWLAGSTRGLQHPQRTAVQWLYEEPAVADRGTGRGRQRWGSMRIGRCSKPAS